MIAQIFQIQISTKECGRTGNRTCDLGLATDCLLRSSFVMLQLVTVLFQMAICAICYPILINT